MSKTVNYTLVKYDRGHLLYIKGSKYPTGYLYYDFDTDEWCTEYHDSDIGHTMIQSRSEAIALILEHSHA